MIIDQKAIERVNSLISLLMETGYVDIPALLNIFEQEDLDDVVKLLNSIGLDSMLDKTNGLQVRLPEDKLRIEKIAEDVSGFSDINLQIAQLVSSTNQVLLEGMGYDVDKVRVYLAEAQLSGRGRRGKHWISPFAKSLYLSIGFASDIDNLSHLYPLRAAVAIQALLTKLGVPKSAIKWPNDIFVDDKKIAGILVESKLSGNRQIVVIGIGLNVYFDQGLEKEIDQPVGFLQHYIQPQNLSRNKIAAGLLDAMMQMISEPLTVPDLFKKWSASDMFKGRQVMLINEGQEHVGTAVGLSPNGEYIIRSDNKDVAVDSSHSSIRLLG